MSNDFVSWVSKEIGSRGWSDSELARRIGIHPSTVSRILNRERNLTWDFCAGVARAFGMPADDIFRRAELLPPLPLEVAEEKEITSIVRGLLPLQRQSALAMLRGLAGLKTPATSQSPVREFTLQDLPAELLMEPEAMERAIDWWSEILANAPAVAHPILARLLYVAANWYEHGKDVRQLIEDILKDENIADGVKKKMIEAMQESRREE
jgi:transcriptional regulator with XRE-family HTH domain